MPDEAAQPAKELRSPEDRMSGLENAFALDSRLLKLEAEIRERIPENRPWWRDAKTVTILGSLIAAVLPLLKFIDDYSRNSRENHRQVIEQQEKIRQTYLEKVLKPGASASERQRIFGLLKELSADPEMQKWAQKEFDRNDALIKDWEKQRDEALKKKEDLCVQVRSATYADDSTKSLRAQVYGLDLKLRDLTEKLVVPVPLEGCGT